jgi:flagellar basal body-associated protein FliL
LANEKENPTKVGDEQNNKPNAEAANSGAESSEEELLSLENLDDMLAEVDPDFAKSLAEIGPDDSSIGEIYNEGVGLEYTLADEQKLWESVQGKKKALLKVFPFIPRISYRYKMAKTSFRLNRVKYRENLIHAIKNAGPSLGKWLKGGVTSFKTKMSTAMAAFGYFSMIKKLGFILLLVLTIGSAVLIQRIFSKGILHDEHGLFMSSFEEWADSSYSYNPSEGMESFYDSLRTPQNMLQLEKMIVNLRRSATSGVNPMGAFEFIVEGAASDVVVEIKDREPEMRDLFQRTIEEMTFDQVSSGEGKQLLCEKLRKAVNSVLTKGKVRRIFIKTAIIKP